MEAFMRTIRFTRQHILVFLIVISISQSKVECKSPTESRVVCYYTNWSAYRQGPAKFLPDNINPYLCTHLIYAFGGLTSDSGIKPFDKYQDIDKGGYTKFNGLKTYNKALKTLIAIGGWNEGSGRFSRLVADPQARKSFVKHTIRFLRQHHFDGLDLDWEYPAARDGGQPPDKKNYAIFIKELKDAFEDESRSTGRTRLLLTIAVPAGIEWIQKGFDIPAINRNVDFFNLLTYDFHASTEPAANHHAPLKPRDGFSDYDYKSQLNIEYAINYYLEEGADSEKLVVGLPTYGRSFTLFNPDSTDIGAPASGPGTKGKYTKEPGYLAYYEICEGIKAGDWRVENELSETQGPHAVKDDQWVGYDDTRIMAIKAKWVRDNKLGGIMFWSIDNDDFRGYCDGKAYPLIEAAKLAYLTGESPELRTKSSSLNTNRLTTSKLKRPTTPAPPSTTTSAPLVSNRKKGVKKPTTPKPRRRRIKTQTITSTTPVPVTSDPFKTPPPPTTPETAVDFECKDDGFFPHPRDCKKYFWCLDAPGLGIVAHHFTCPAGLYFNKNTDSCDYSRNVPCKPGGTPTTVATTTTTTTTTTPSPEEPEYEYYDEEDEDDEPEIETSVKVKPSKVPSSGKSSQDLQDIRNLLGIIKKLGGVEELEKYLEDNPDVADEVEQIEAQEEQPSSSTAKSVAFTPRNRFSTSTQGPLKRITPKTYTSIQRPPSSRLNSQEDATTTQKAVTPISFRPKYVTLNRGDKKGVTSSTQTSIVFRYSNEDKLIDDDDEDSTPSSSSKPVTYVTSRPYSKVVASQEEESQLNENKSRYVTLSRIKNTSITPEVVTKRTTESNLSAPDVLEDEYENTEEEYEDEPTSVVAPSTTTISTTTTPAPTTTKARLRAPLRPRPFLTFKTTTSTTSSTTTEPETRVTPRPFTPSIRRNALFDRRRLTPESLPGTTTSSTTSPILNSTTQQSRQRSRFRSSTIPSTNDVSSEVFHDFSREITQTTTTTTLSPFQGSFQSAVIRRRTRKPVILTTIPSTSSTTTTASTTINVKTTSKPTDPSQVNRIVPIADSGDYYYYVYEDDDDPLDKSQSQVPLPNLFQRRSSENGVIDSPQPKLRQGNLLLTPKIKISEDGGIACGDKGVYTHPNSCGSQYVRCVQNENRNGYKAWIYSCPSGLSFDPIGGLCNWAPSANDCPLTFQR